MTVNQQSVVRCLRGHERILICTHINPDGDALGSLAALGYIVKAMGKDFRLHCPSRVPADLDWIEFPAAVLRGLADLKGWTPDLLVCADCADARRCGPAVEAFFNGHLPAKGWDGLTSLCIDHHESNPGFATLNWVEPKSPATAELAGLLAEEAGVPLKGALADSVYLGLVSDTGSFSYSSTTSRILDLASRIVENGLNVGEFTEKYQNNWSLSRMHLWAALMGRLRLYAKGRVLLTVVDNATMAEYNCGASDLEDFASWLRRIKGVKVVLFVRERPDGSSKISLRSMGDIDVRAVAEAYGGGGHISAAGAELPLPPEDCAQEVLKKLLKHMGE